MTCKSYIAVLTDIGFPKDIANIIDDYATWEYKDYLILTDKIVEIFVENSKYLNVKLLHIVITNILIKNFGLTFSDFLVILRSRLEIRGYTIKKIGLRMVFWGLINHVTSLILSLVHWNGLYDRHSGSESGNVIYDSVKSLFHDSLQKSGIKSGLLDKNINFLDFIENL